MQLSQRLSQILAYRSADEVASLHEQALTEILRVILQFIDQPNEGDGVRWVMNAAPGHGKTAAMTLALRFLSDQHPKRSRVPALIALRYVPGLQELESALNQHHPGCCKAIYADNRDDYIEDLGKYQFVLITHARLKNLERSAGQFNQFYKWWKPLGTNGEPEFTKKRVLIVDEMPEMVEGVIFDLGTTNNAVDWFDKLAAEGGISEEDRIYGRSIIMLLLAKELCLNKDATNRALNSISEEALTLAEILGKLPKTSGDQEAIWRMGWFSKIFTEAGVARLYIDQDGRRLLAARKIDYARLGVPILVLDGTADVTVAFYGGYEFKSVNNYNDYSRLFLFWRQITTTARSRAKSKKDVQTTIARDALALRKQGIHPFPITAKSDFGTYKELGIITPEHQACFDEGSEGDSFVFHLQNLAGSNRLNEESALYLTSLPIMNPDAYRLMAFALYGPGVSLELARRDSGEEGWFADPAVEAIYSDWLTAELLQLIHRSALRDISGSGPVSIYMAHKVKWVMERLQDCLSLPSENTDEQELFNPALAGFEDKVRRFGQDARYHFDKVDTFNGQATVESVSGQFNNLLQNLRAKEETLIATEINPILLKDYNVEVGRDSRRRRMVWDRRTS